MTDEQIKTDIRKLDEMLRKQGVPRGDRRTVLRVLLPEQRRRLLQTSWLDRIKGAM